MVNLKKKGECIPIPDSHFHFLEIILFLVRQSNLALQ